MLTWRRCAVTGAAVLGLAGGQVQAATAEAQPDLSRFYRQRVAWTVCDDPGAPKDLQCGKVTVPLDYARPAAGTLDLALARYRASGHRKGSVVLDFGGPGGAGVPQLAHMEKNFADLTNQFDVVSFDPRGVGRSSPVTCGTWNATEGITADPSDTGTLLGQIRAVADRCARASGPVLPYIGTVDVARDLDVIRAALGDGKLNYLGFSYGTRLGAVYAAQFPHRVGRFALDGVDTLTEPLAEQARVGAAGQQVALDDFLAWCARAPRARNPIGTASAAPACPLGHDARTARDATSRLIDKLDAHPQPLNLGGEFTGQDLVAAFAQALYSPQWWPALTRGLDRLIRYGDPSGVLSFSVGGSQTPSGRTPNTRTPNTPATGTPAPGTRIPTPHAHTPHTPLTAPQNVPADNLGAALMAVNCADDPDRPSAARITAQLPSLRAAFEQASPVFGRYRLTEVLMCYGRPKGTDFIREHVKDVPTPKMLLVGTRGDPATPYRWTTETAARLGDSAVVLDNRGEGHTGYLSSKCVHRTVDDFLRYGSLPPGGSSCGGDGTGNGAGGSGNDGTGDDG